MPAHTPSVVRTLRALQQRGFSLRGLALEAGIDPSLLTRIMGRERTLTPEVAAKLSAALERWATECRTGAVHIRQASKEER
jgi:plasmid maintenance system antidote protein VapI